MALTLTSHEIGTTDGSYLFCTESVHRISCIFVTTAAVGARIPETHETRSESYISMHNASYVLSGLLN